MKRYKPLILEDIHNDQTTTPEFKRWFGKSKVKKSGKPVVVYHGTNKKFDIFNDKNIGATTGNFGHYGYGFYFSYDIREAKGYGNVILPVYLRIENPFYGDRVSALSKYAKEFGSYEKVNIAVDRNWLLSALKKKDIIAYNFMLLILKYGYEKGWEMFLKDHRVNESTLDLNDLSQWILATDIKEKEELGDYIVDEISSILGKPKLIQDYPFHSQPQMKYMTNLGSSQSKELTELIKKDGYDGIIAGTEIIAFYSNQIKSATGNNGKFSKSANIYEDITIPLNRGDTILYGKFKNKKAIFDHLERDEKGQDIIVTDKGVKITLLHVRLVRD